MQKVTTGKNASAAVPKKKVESSDSSSESDSSDDEVICGFHSYVTLVLLLVAFGYEYYVLFQDTAKGVAPAASKVQPLKKKDEDDSSEESDTSSDEDNVSTSFYSIC